MSNSTSTAPILNPNVYLNYLPHSTAAQFEVARNVYLATVGVSFYSLGLPSGTMLTVIRFPCAGSRVGYVIESAPGYSTFDRGSVHVDESCVFLVEV